MKPTKMMHILKLIIFVCITALTGLSYAADATNQDVASVKIDVFAQHKNGKIVYQYRVFNKSSRNITAVSIGHDTHNDENLINDNYELYERPSGWSSRYGIPSTSSESPSGWRVNVTAPENSSTHAVTWEPLNLNTPRLLPGQILSKLSVAVDRPDSNYLQGHARVTFTKGAPQELSVVIQQLDFSPPSLMVMVTPSVLRAETSKDFSPNPNFGMIPVKVNFIVEDDYDRKPEIKLESITTNQTVEHGDIDDASFGMDDRYVLFSPQVKGYGDRIYTLTYSATDASGNQTLATATVTVPNHQELKVAPYAAPVQLFKP